jgi:hypothetical protein
MPQVAGWRDCCARLQQVAVVKLAILFFAGCLSDRNGPAAMKPSRNVPLCETADTTKRVSPPADNEGDGPPQQTPARPDNFRVGMPELSFCGERLSQPPE